MLMSRTAAETVNIDPGRSSAVPVVHGPVVADVQPIVL
jgi:hypothetical protein